MLTRYTVFCTVKRKTIITIAAKDPKDAAKRVKRMNGIVRILEVKKEA